MSADRLFYYAPQKLAVHEFMHSIGAPVSTRSPQAVRRGMTLSGLKYISFINIVGHPQPIPVDLMHTLRARGAILIDVTDEHHRLYVQHMSGDCHVS